MTLVCASRTVVCASRTVPDALGVAVAGVDYARPDGSAVEVTWAMFRHPCDGAAYVELAVRRA